jgi:hypothetical protein
MATTGPLTPGTYLTSSVNPSGVVRVVRAKRLHGADGYDVQGDGAYTNFAPDWTCHAAIVGDTVCDQPKGTHWCGLVHVSADLLDRLPRKEA